MVLPHPINYFLQIQIFHTQKTLHKDQQKSLQDSADVFCIQHELDGLEGDPPCCQCIIVFQKFEYRYELPNPEVQQETITAHNGRKERYTASTHHTSIKMIKIEEFVIKQFVKMSTGKRLTSLMSKTITKAANWLNIGKVPIENPS
jgi:hypothetical protein